MSKMFRLVLGCLYAASCVNLCMASYGSGNTGRSDFVFNFSNGYGCPGRPDISQSTGWRISVRGSGAGSANNQSSRVTPWNGLQMASVIAAGGLSAYTAYVNIGNVPLSCCAAVVGGVLGARKRGAFVTCLIDCVLIGLRKSGLFEWIGAPIVKTAAPFVPYLRKYYNDCYNISKGLMSACGNVSLPKNGYACSGFVIDVAGCCPGANDYYQCVTQMESNETQSDLCLASLELLMNCGNRTGIYNDTKQCFEFAKKNQWCPNASNYDQCVEVCRVKWLYYK